jgi:hypothetical protein
MVDYPDLLENAHATVDDAAAELGAAVGEILSDASETVTAALAPVGSVVAELEGEVDYRIDPHISTVGQLLERILTDLDRRLDRYVGELTDSGLNVPTNPAILRDLLDVTPGEWLPAVVPALGELFANEANEGTSALAGTGPAGGLNGYAPAADGLYPVAPSTGRTDGTDPLDNPPSPVPDPPPVVLPGPPGYCHPGCDPPELQPDGRCLANLYNDGNVYDVPVCPPDGGPPPGPLPEPPGCPPDDCPGPGGYPWFDSPRGRCLIQHYQDNGIFVVQRWDDVLRSHVWTILDTNLAVPGSVVIAVGPAVGADGSPYSYEDVCNGQQPPPAVPPVVPPVTPVPDPTPFPPPTVPPGCCPPQAPPVVNVYPQPATCPAPPASPPVTPTVPPAPPPVAPSPVSTVVPAGPAPALDWSKGATCDAVPEAINQFIGGGEQPDLPPRGEGNLPGWMSWLRRQGRSISASLPWIDSRDLNTTQEVKDAVADQAVKYHTGSTLLDKVLGAVGVRGINNPYLTASIGGTLAMANFAERTTGFPITYLTQNVNYAYQYLNPQHLPDQTGVDRLWLTSRINDKTWECLTRANGNIVSWHSDLVDSQVGRANIGELVQLYYRKELSEDQFVKRAADIGWRNKSYVSEVVKLFQQLPTMDSQIRYAVRDSWDPKVVQRYGYDTGWKEKFADNPKALELAQATGVNPDYLRMDWWAHWEIPSNTQLYDALHRFHPGRPERVAWEKDNKRLVNPDGTLESDWDYYHRGPLAVTEAMVSEAIQVNDMAPGWVRAMVELSYRPITNTDASRAYIVGAFTADQLYWAFIANGYNDANAKLLVDFYKLLAVKRLSNETGVWTVRKIAQHYKEGSISRIDASNLMLEQLGDFQKTQQMLDRIDREVDADTLRTKIKDVRKQFMTAGIEEGDVRIYLDIAGVQPWKADQLIRKWSWEREHSARNASAMMLCKWRSRNLITPEEHFRRLRILGYSVNDAARISTVCAVEAAEKLAAKEEAERRRRLKDVKEACKTLLLLHPELKPHLGPLCGVKPDKEEGGGK